ncbi:hypothetical protein OSTOST_00657, partial [Ostertagia ostertagi]
RISIHLHVCFRTVSCVYSVHRFAEQPRTIRRYANCGNQANRGHPSGSVLHFQQKSCRSDGVTASAPKRTEKQPLQKSYRSLDNDRPIPDVVPEGGEFLDAQPGVAPKLSGPVATPSPIDFEFFDFGENSGGQVAATNPAATYLEGGDFDKITPPKCRMTGCTGPVPNDGSLMVDAPTRKGKACHQTFVPMNGCTDNKGYPMGMLCSICCDCTASFVREMRKTQGFKIGFGSI